jgi:flagellar basal-body rod modification protein FlgD
MSPIPSTNSSAASAANSNGLVNSSSVAIDKSMFLQLMVAQLKNQDPMKPTDSSTFVTQLAQFQQLESTVNMGQDVSGIKSDADQFLSAYNAGAAAASSATGTNSTTQS